MQVKQSEDELRQELISNVATDAAAIYYLLVARLARSADAQQSTTYTDGLTEGLHGIHY